MPMAPEIVNSQNENQDTLFPDTLIYWNSLKNVCYKPTNTVKGFKDILFRL